MHSVNKILILTYISLDCIVYGQYSEQKALYEAWKDGSAANLMAEIKKLIGGQKFCEYFQENVLPQKVSKVLFKGWVTDVQLYAALSQYSWDHIPFNAVLCDITFRNPKKPAATVGETESWMISPMKKHKFCRVVDLPEKLPTIYGRHLHIKTCYRIDTGFVGKIQKKYRQLKSLKKSDENK